MDEPARRLVGLKTEARHAARSKRAPNHLVTPSPQRLAKGAHALLPLLVEFSVIAVAATLMGAGYAMALAWDRLTDLW